MFNVRLNVIMIFNNLVITLYHRKCSIPPSPGYWVGIFIGHKFMIQKRKCPANIIGCIRIYTLFQNIPIKIVFQVIHFLHIQYIRQVSVKIRRYSRMSSPVMKIIRPINYHLRIIKCKTIFFAVIFIPYSLFEDIPTNIELFPLYDLTVYGILINYCPYPSITNYCLSIPYNSGAPDIPCP